MGKLGTRSWNPRSTFESSSSSRFKSGPGKRTKISPRSTDPRRFCPHIGVKRRVLPIIRRLEQMKELLSRFDAFQSFRRVGIVPPTTNASEIHVPVSLTDFQSTGEVNEPGKWPRIPTTT
jgi:hypothetical protein